VATACFAFKLSLFANGGIAATSFAQVFYKMRTARMQSVLAEFPSQFIRGIINIYSLELIIERPIEECTDVEASCASICIDLISVTCSLSLLKYFICEIVNRMPAIIIVVMIGIQNSFHFSPAFVSLCSFLFCLTGVFFEAALLFQVVHRSKDMQKHYPETFPGNEDIFS
jgi:hypothetical protein